MRRELDRYGDERLAEWLESDDALHESAVDRMMRLLKQYREGAPLTFYAEDDVFSEETPKDLLVWLDDGGPVVTIRRFSSEDPVTRFSIVRIGPEERPPDLGW